MADSMFPATPQMNPTGATGNGGITPPSSMTGGSGNFGFGNTMNPNPGVQTWGSQPNYSGGTTPVQNPTGSPASGNQFTSPLGPTGGSELQYGLQQTYGQGIGSVLEQFLQSGGGYNSPITQQAVTAQEAAMQQAIQRGWGDQASHFAESGISPNSSTYALGQADYYSNAATQENALIAQEFYNMWNQSQSNETSILGEVAQGAGTWKANQTTGWDVFSSILGGATSALSTAGDLGWTPFS